MINILKRKVFINYHHVNDEEYKKEFVELFCDMLDGFIDSSVWDNENHFKIDKILEHFKVEIC